LEWTARRKPAIASSKVKIGVLAMTHPRFPSNLSSVLFGVRNWENDTSRKGAKCAKFGEIEIDFFLFILGVLGAASLAADNWLGESPDNGRFPVRPFSLTPNVVW
jgi:hypothetical protein